MVAGDAIFFHSAATHMNIVFHAVLILQEYFLNCLIDFSYYFPDIQSYNMQNVTYCWAISYRL